MILKKIFFFFFFKLMNNEVFRKTIEKVSKHRDIQLATTEKRRNCLVSELIYYKTKFFPENVLVIKMKKSQISMNKLVYLGLSILDQKQPFRVVLRKRCSENMQQTYRRTPMLKSPMPASD